MQSMLPTTCIWHDVAVEPLIRRFYGNPMPYYVIAITSLCFNNQANTKSIINPQSIHLKSTHAHDLNDHINPIDHIDFGHMTVTKQHIIHINQNVHMLSHEMI